MTVYGRENLHAHARSCHGIFCIPHLACSHLSVRCIFLSCSHAQRFFLKSSSGGGDSVSECTLRVRWLVKLTRPTLKRSRWNLVYFQYLWSLEFMHLRASLGYTPFSSHINWCLTVILTLRTWAVWNRNRRLTIILPTLYTLFCASSFIIVVRWVNSMTCKWNFCAHS